MKKDNFKATKEPKNLLSWSNYKEAYLIDLWAEKIAENPVGRQRPRIHTEMYEAMKKKGFKVELPDIYAKLTYFRRKYRTELAKNKVSKWCHFPKVAKILDPDIKVNHDDDVQYIPDDPLPTTFSSVYFTEYSPGLFDKADKSNAKEAEVDVLTEYQSNVEDIAPPAKNNETDQLNPFLIKHDINPIYSEFALFSQLVAKELSQLDEDLCIETQRNIFNIICDANIKQIERNNTRVP